MEFSPVRDIRRGLALNARSTHPDRTTLKKAQALQNEIVEMRRHLHAHPELSFLEKETGKLVAEKLSALGYAVKSGIGKTGVIADLGRDSSKKIAIRADMDALPVEEGTDHPYHSKNKGVMHACGHDAHMACGLAAAKIWAADANSTPGSLRMLMQPAEEFGDADGKSGAYRMIEDGALEGITAIIGLHMDASLPAGKVGIAAGPVMAAADAFKVTISGRGGHGAFPENAVDPVVIGAQVVQAIQQIVSRKISALDPAIITIGSFQSSSVRGNVISDHVTLLGTIRTFNKQVRKTIFEELEKACSIAKILGGAYRIDYEAGYPTTINDPKTTEIMRQAAIDLIGEENVITLPPKPWSEDFSMYQELVPGTFMFLGCEIAGDRRSHHAANFDLDESGLYIGSAVLAETAKRLLTQLD
jgi:amidohydrolase